MRGNPVEVMDDHGSVAPAALARAQEPAASVVSLPAEVPGMDLTIAFFADPDGHVVGLSHGATAV
jgi:hypothetical protein